MILDGEVSPERNIGAGWGNLSGFQRTEWIFMRVSRTGSAGMSGCSGFEFEARFCKVIQPAPD